MDLDITNIINVTVSGVPKGLSEKNVNSVMLFTTETPSNVDSYREYLSPKTVGTDYGTSSVTKKMADRVFSQSPNILTGKGRLLIAPLQNSVSATQGTFTTSNISANLSDIKLVTDGKVRVTLNGNNIDLTGLNFSAASTFTDVAKILQAKLDNVIVEAVSTTGLKLTSKKVGDDSDITMATVTGTGTDLSGSGYFNVSGATTVSGVDATGETIAEAITRLEGDVSFVGMMTNLEMEDDVLTALATTVQAQNRILVHHATSKEDIAGAITTIKNASNKKTRIVLYTKNPAESNLAKAAYVGRAFSTNFNGSNVAQTMQLKQLASVTADSGINQTDYTNALAAGSDMYVSFEGRASVVSAGGNDFFDNVYHELWLKFTLETAGLNHLARTNTKVPQTEEGMDGLKSAYEGVLQRAVRAGIIGVGLTWNSSETFGDPENLKRSITDQGYYIYSLPISQQAQAVRGTRAAPLVQIAIKNAGAIHSSDVIAIIEN